PESARPAALPAHALRRAPQNVARHRGATDRTLRRRVVPHAHRGECVGVGEPCAGPGYFPACAGEPRREGLRSFAGGTAVERLPVPVKAVQVAEVITAVIGRGYLLISETTSSKVTARRGSVAAAVGAMTQDRISQCMYIWR